jgi:pSer/pThr/pTyr-binding forkhead associated (FHA) protein
MLSKLMGREGEYALRFEAGVRAGEVLRLLPDHELVFGRAPDVGIMLEDSRVSRQHAAISMAGQHVVVRDLGSRNGTFVNGQRVEKARLKPGDRIRIGASVIVVETVATVPVEAERTGLRAVAGRIKQTPVVDVLERLAGEGRTGRLTIQSGKNRGGIG